ncbi:MAG: 4Fe-4S dicluster domain-containing protein [Desulfobaccales bacterium]
MEINPTQPLVPAFALQERLAKEMATPLSSCFQCKKCSAGCPLTFAMDVLPDRVIRLALLGQTEALLGCRTIWVCAACVTCSTRCPNGIDIAGVMDWLKEEAIRQGKTIDQPEVAVFHRFFLASIRRAGGRLPEVALMRRFTLYKLRRRPQIRELWENFKLGWGLLRRGRLHPAGPPALKGRDEIKEIFRHSGA